MPASTGYRELLNLSGVSLPVVSFLARLPQAMGQIGTLLLVTSTTGSLGSAGLVAGALAIGQAVGGPLVGGLADRRGQRGVVLVASIANLIATVLLLGAAVAGATLPTLLGLGALTGITIPQIAPLARARWIALTSRRPGDDRLVGTAFSLEGALDESSFVAGPAIAGILAAAIHPGSGLALTAMLVGVFGVGFALHPTARHTAQRPTARGTPAAPSGRVLNPALVVLCAVMIVQGLVFGATQTGVTALAEHAGHAGLAGVLYAAMGLTSATAALGTAAVPSRIGLPVRLRITTAAMTVLGIPLLFIAGIPALLVVLLAFGVTVGPYMITGFSLVERVVPVTRLASVMGLMTSLIVVGYAIGSSLGGALADAHGHNAAFAITCGAALTAFMLALATGRESWYRKNTVTPRPDLAETT